MKFYLFILFTLFLSLHNNAYAELRFPSLQSETFTYGLGVGALAEDIANPKLCKSLTVSPARLDELMLSH